MINAAFSEIVLNGSQEEANWQYVFNSLMSPEKQDLSLVVDFVNEKKLWTEEFRYGLEALQSFRTFYGEHSQDMSADQRAQIEAFDESWSLELLDFLHRVKFGVDAGKE